MWWTNKKKQSSFFKDSSELSSTVKLATAEWEEVQIGEGWTMPVAASAVFPQQWQRDNDIKLRENKVHRVELVFFFFIQVLNFGHVSYKYGALCAHL